MLHELLHSAAAAVLSFVILSALAPSKLHFFDSESGVTLV